jgi:hypothetical protein
MGIWGEAIIVHHSRTKEKAEFNTYIKREMTLEAEKAALIADWMVRIGRKCNVHEKKKKKPAEILKLPSTV